MASKPDAIRSKDLRLLQTLGFWCVSGQNCDYKKPVVEITEDTQAPKGTKDPEQYKEAFANFARLFGSGNVITAGDLAYLRQIPNAELADLIENDPSMQTITINLAPIEKGKTSIDRRVPPRSQKRIMAYLQMAINCIYEKDIVAGKITPLVMNGKFDDATTAALQRFAKDTAFVGLDRSGMLIGPHMVAAIVFSLRYSKEDIIEMLRSEAPKIKKGFTLYPTGYFSPIFKTENAIFMALQYLGMISLYDGPASLADCTEAQEIINENFKANKADETEKLYIGPILIGRIIKALENAK